MEVAILYCQDCFFSQRAHAQLLKALESIIGIDRQKLNLALHTFDLKDIESHSKAQQIHRAKAQIVIISHHFLDRLRHEMNVRKKTSPINRILRTKRVIAILLSVTPEEVTEGFQELQFPEWHSIPLKSSNKLDPEFYKKFAEQVVRIYNVELSNTIAFSIFPKKVTKDQPKVVILFKTALEPTDKVNLELTRGNHKESIGEVMMSNPHAGMIRIPRIQALIAFLCEERTSLIEISPYVNSKLLGTKLIKFEHNSKRCEEDVIDRISSAIPGFRKALDDHISQQLSRNFRSCEDFTMDSSLELMNAALISRGGDLPTVMHFAVHYGLEQTVCVLLYEGDGLEQSTVKNDVGETAVDMAQEKGFGNIGQTIKDFYEMTNTFGALQYIKDLCDRHSEELELLSEGTRESSRSTITLTKMEADGTPTTPLVSGGGQQENPEYMVVRLESETSTDIHTEGTDGDEDFSINEMVRIRVEAMIEERAQLGEELVLEETSEETNSLHLHVPPSSYTQQDQDYVNLSEAESVEITIDARSVFLPNYDVPPPPSPVMLSKPPRTIGSGPHLAVTTNHYDVPRGSLGGHYCHIPLTPPSLPEKLSLNSSKPSAPILSVKSNQPFQSPDGYLWMESNNVSETRTVVTMPPSPALSHKPRKPARATKPAAAMDPNSQSIKYPKVLPPEIQLPRGLSTKGFLNTDRTSPLPLTKQFSLDSTQEELLELMNDFKNNVYNLRELELLYENWKQRNDVQRDFKARQKELREIQKEYKKIQEKVRRETKKSGGPIAKLLKLIPGSRKKNSVTAIDPSLAGTVRANEPPPTDATDDSERKISGSSEHESTLSEASVPDSGVSDPDSDRDRLRYSYVGPSEIPLNFPEPVTVDVVPPPVRPPKKPSISSDPPTFPGRNSPPPRSPKMSVTTPPILEEYSDPTHNPLLPMRKDGDTEAPNGNDITAPPPHPPPRVMKMDSPFSYINYEGKTRGLPGLNLLKQVPSNDKSNQRTKSSYENEISKKK